MIADEGLFNTNISKSHINDSVTYIVVGIHPEYHVITKISRISKSFAQISDEECMDVQLLNISLSLEVICLFVPDC